MNAQERYLAAAHAVQTGVAFEQANGSNDGTPKHLRVGINTSKCDHAALVRLLIAKGVIAEGEYLEAIADEMEQEVLRYQERIQARYPNGANITLA